MDVFQAGQASQQSASVVQQYLAELTQPEDGADHRGGLVGRLCAECIAVFRETLRAVSHDREALNGGKAYTSLERSYGRLKLWSDGHGIAAGKFDEVFDRSKGLRQTVLKLMISISHTLTERLIPLALAGHDTSAPALVKGIHLLRELQDAAESIQSDDFSDSSSDDLDSDTIGDVVEDLKTDTTCLADLDHLLKDPILEIDVEQAAPADRLLDWHPDRVYSHKIGARFPQADVSLVDWLGKANYFRYLRCQQARETCAEATTHVAAPAKSETASSKFNDSGLGSSLPSTIPYAETVMSYGGRGSQSVRIPPLTAEAKAGAAFPCIACGKIVSITSNSMWKKHLFEDLRPWMCLDMACPSSQSAFENRQDWASHLALDHKLDPEWASFNCQLCLEPTGPGRVAITGHLAAHLEEVSLAAIPSQLDFDDDSSQSRFSSSTDGEGLYDDDEEEGLYDDEDEDEEAESTTKLSHAEKGAPASDRPRTTDALLRVNIGKMIEVNDEKDGESLAETTSQRGLEAAIAVKVGNEKDASLKQAHKELDMGNDPTHPPADTEGIQKHPDTFQCSLCPRRFTRAYNLRSHLRRHTGGRPFICGMCGTAFARRGDCKRHEELHLGEKRFVCKGDLKAGGQWGCGRRFSRADALGRHFRSKAGRICIKPLLDEEAEARRHNSLANLQTSGSDASQNRHSGNPVDASPQALLNAAIDHHENQKDEPLQTVGAPNGHQGSAFLVEGTGDPHMQDRSNSDSAIPAVAATKQPEITTSNVQPGSRLGLQPDMSHTFFNSAPYSMPTYSTSPRFMPLDLTALDIPYIAPDATFDATFDTAFNPILDVGVWYPLAETASKLEADEVTSAEPRREGEIEAGAAESPQKPVKRLMACTSCRLMKVKCDGRLPACGTCFQKNRPCDRKPPQETAEKKVTKEGQKAAAAAAEPRAGASAFYQRGETAKAGGAWKEAQEARAKAERARMQADFRAQEEKGESDWLDSIV